MGNDLKSMEERTLRVIRLIGVIDKGKVSVLGVSKLLEVARQTAYVAIWNLIKKGYIEKKPYSNEIIFTKKALTWLEMDGGTFEAGIDALNERHRKILDYMMSVFKKTLIIPTYREISEYIGISISSVGNNIHKLIEDGWLRMRFKTVYPSKKTRSAYSLYFRDFPEPGIVKKILKVHPEDDDILFIEVDNDAAYSINKLRSYIAHEIDPIPKMVILPKGISVEKLGKRKFNEAVLQRLSGDDD